jgi:flavin-dependent dehydrogenase
LDREEVCIVVMAERAEHASFDSALRELPELREKLGGARAERPGTRCSHRDALARNVQRGNVALVGDASGGVDAITGEGLRLSFRQAILLADAMAAGDLRPYQRAHRQLERRPMRMGNLMLWLGRNPRIRGRVIRALQSKPDLFARLLATHVGQGTSKRIAVDRSAARLATAGYLNCGFSVPGFLFRIPAILGSPSV